MRSVIGLGALLLVTSGGAAAESAPIWRPLNNWNVDYSRNMCVLSRDFGEGSERVTLAIRPSPMSNHLRVALMLPLTDWKPRKGRATIQFDQLPPDESRYESGPIRKRDVNIIAIDTSRSTFAPFSSAKLLRIAADEIAVALAPTNVEAAMKALAACETDLVKSWGMDPVARASVATFPSAIGHMGNYLATDDYPLEALQRRQQGDVGVRFWVGTDGRATDCKIVESSGSQALDRRTCQIVTLRFRFDPAKTGDGTPIRSLSFIRINWSMPDL